jgi:hypothetical protein
MSRTLRFTSSLLALKRIKLIPAYYCMHSCFLSLWLIGNGESSASDPPNATLQAPPMAEATQERRLLTVACKRLLGPGSARPLARVLMDKWFQILFLPTYWAKEAYQQQPVYGITTQA